MGSRRRDRISYLVLLRRVSEYTSRACALRVGMLLVVVTGSAFSARLGWAWLMTVPAALSCYLSIAHWRSGRTGNPPRFWLSAVYSRSLLRTDSRHQLNMGSQLDIPGGFLLVAVPSWVTIDLGTGLRLGMLAAAVCFLVNVAACIFNDQTWFNPEETTPPLWHEVFRYAAGPVVAVPVAVIAIPAPWPADARWAVLILAAAGLNASVRVWDTDLTLKYTAPLVREEAKAGRDLVVNETHGALSTNLRLLEQQSRAYRATDPGLYDLAVSANSRLRETLALASATINSADDLQTLAAPVYTLARAVGAKVEVRIDLARLGPDDRHLARLVLNDLVGNALNAGATAVEVRIFTEGGLLGVSVADDAMPIPGGVWKTSGTSSARLEARLLGLSGSLAAEHHGHGKVVSARWRAQDEAAKASDGQERDPSPAR